MSSDASSTSSDEVSRLRQQLEVARAELNNLRGQMKALSFARHKDNEQIQAVLRDFKCPSCSRPSARPEEEGGEEEDCLTVRYIGRIRSQFPERRATPRQTGLCLEGIGELTLNNCLLTNPEHSLEGLEGFSHAWILFHFHKNEPGWRKAKVAPPRLNGLRVGVFSTRSPHRPNPIGLSLVKIEAIEGPTLRFSGLDMVDGTPVLDIKPYIPRYDQEALQQPPRELQERWSRQRSLIGSSEEREAPDGEEEEASSAAAPPGAAQVPPWVDSPPSEPLSVSISDRAVAQLLDLVGDDLENRKALIFNVLREDPRSVYLRQRHSGQYYTFRVAELYVACKFNDSDRSMERIVVWPDIERERQKVSLEHVQMTCDDSYNSGSSSPSST